MERGRDENSKVVDIGDGWSMEVGVIHRLSTHNPPPRRRLAPIQPRLLSAPRADNKWQIRRRTHSKAP